MSYEVQSYAERTSSMERVEGLLHSMRSGPGPHIDWCREVDARMTAIEAFDVRQAEAGDPIAARQLDRYRQKNREARVFGADLPHPNVPPPGAQAARPTPQASAPARPADARDAVLSAMRAMNRTRPTT